MRTKPLVSIVLTFLLAVTIYGIVHERLYTFHNWGRLSAPRLLGYAVVCLAVAGPIVWRRPRWLGPTAAVIVLIYTIWWGGLSTPFAVLYFLGSCFLLGRQLARASHALIATLLGAAAWMLVIWIALHFPVNMRWVYAGAFLIPYLAPAVRGDIRLRGWNLPQVGRKEAAALAVLLTVLLAHWLLALKPEISDDGLAMHLVVPMAVAHDARWSFDFQHQAWALMPAGGESLYTAVYLLGGETASRLLNFAFLAMIAAGVALEARRWVSPAWAYLGAALFASTPLVQLVSGSLFVENIWGAMVLGAWIELRGYRESKRASDLVITGALLGAALAVKVLAGAFALPMAILALFTVFQNRQWRVAAMASVLGLVLAAPAYIYAYEKSGNPVFPFMNQVFKSPYWDTETPFADPRYQAALTWKTPYELTFRSDKFSEVRGGAAGFQYFLLLAPALLLLRRRAGAVLMVASAAAVTILLFTHYLRYLYPALALFSIAIAGLAAETPPTATAAGFLLLIGLNLWFNPASDPYDRDFALFRHADVRPYLERYAPERFLIDYLNRTAPGEPVAFFGSEFIAGLNAPAYNEDWHSEPYWKRIRSAESPEEITSILRSLGIRHVIATVSRASDSATVRRFLEGWLDSDGPAIGSFAAYRVRESVTGSPSRRLE